MIIERLKSFFDDGYTLNQQKIIINSAIDTIEALRAENAKLQAKSEFIYDALLETKGEIVRLREALKPFADVAEHDICESLTDADIFRPMTREYSRASMLTVGDLRAARAAMGESDE